MEGTAVMSAQKKPLYSILLPTYNEVESLPILIYLLVEILQKHEINFEIIVVDDSSPDGTLQVANKLAELYSPYIKIKSRTGKLGLGTAYAYGLGFCKGEFTILMDSDLSHHVPPFIILAQNHSQHDQDATAGKFGYCDWHQVKQFGHPRYEQGGSIHGWSWFRILTSRVANLLALVALNPGHGLSDLTGSFRLYRTDLLKELISSCSAAGYSFQMEIIVRAAAKKNIRIGQVPISFVDRLLGSSKLGTGEIFQYLKGVICLFFTDLDK